MVETPTSRLFYISLRIEKVLIYEKICIFRSYFENPRCFLMLFSIKKRTEFLRNPGEMTEWLKVRAWKVRIPQKGIVGSNPAFSAT